MEQIKEMEKQLKLGPLLLLDGVINKNFNSRIFFDQGCNMYGVISHEAALKYHLPRKTIRSRTISAWNGKNDASTSEIADCFLDLQGYTKRVWLYVVENLPDSDIVLGSRWFEVEQAISDMVQRKILLPNGQNLIASEDLPKLECLSVMILKYQLRQERSEGREPVIFRATLKDIEKALQPKPPKDLSKLPFQYQKFQKLFREQEAAQLPPHRPGHDMKIELQEGKEAPWGPLYQMSREELLVLRKELNDLLSRGLIRPSSSPASAPVLFARKPGGGLRFCIDYRQLNRVVKKDRYPLPLFSETLQRISKSKWLTKLDVVAAFHKLRIAPGDEWLTAFRTSMGLFEWLAVPFGFVKSPGTFQRFVNHVLHPFSDYVTAYVDDILIFTDGSLQDHEEKVRKVLQALLDAELYLDIDKCEFSVQKTRYLGYIIEAGKKIAMDPDKIKAIQEWTELRTVKEVRSFLGFVGFYRRFIARFSELEIPLTNLTRKNVSFQWGKLEQEAFDGLKNAVIRASTLVPFDPDRVTRIETDASRWAIGGVLTQRIDNDFRPVAFYSKKLSPAECNYPIHDRELLAVIKALDTWRAELKSVRTVTAITDHKSLEYFTSKQQLNERQARWTEKLVDFNVEFIYRPGNDNGAADALSRRPQDMPMDNNDSRVKERNIQIVKFGAAQMESSTGKEELWLKAINQDAQYQQWLKSVKQGNQQWENPKPPVTISECSSLDGKLLFRNRYWVPDYEPLRTNLIEEAHNSRLTGHPGRSITSSILRQQYYWPNMEGNVARYIRNCESCGRNRIWREKEGLLKPLPIANSVWRHLGIDFVTKLPSSQDFYGNKYENLLVVVDRLSKGVILAPMQSLTTAELVSVFLDRVISQHGLPDSIVSDRGSQFTALFWQQLCKKLQIKHSLSTAYHPETDGATERSNQVVKDYLRKFCDFSQSNWVELLPTAQLAIASRPATSTGLPPFLLTHGTLPRIWSQPTKEPEVPTVPSTDPASKILQKLQKASEWAQAAIADAQQRQEQQANRRRKPPPRYKKGDKVWLSLENIATERPSRSLDNRSAKFTVTDVPGSHTVELDVPPGIHNRFHVNLVRMAGNDPFPSQEQIDTEPLPISVYGHEEYFVDKIVKQRVRNGNQQVLVKWTGYERPTWEPVQNLLDTAAWQDWLAERRFTS